MSDYISRADAIEAVHKYFIKEIYKTPHEIDEDDYDLYTDMTTVNSLLVCNKELSKALKALPSAELPNGDLISRADVLKYPIRLDHYDEVNGSREFVYGVESVIEYVESLPSADRQSGEWQRVDEQPYFRKHYHKVCCSVCHKQGSEKYNYCPNCGARMGNDDDDLDGLKIIAIIDGKGGAE